ncbi:MAG: hypothetical protein ACT4NL_14995 [Pseudomarimonas sp.]
MPATLQLFGLRFVEVPGGGFVLQPEPPWWPSSGVFLKKLNSPGAQVHIQVRGLRCVVGGVRLQLEVDQLVFERDPNVADALTPTRSIGGFRLGVRLDDTDPLPRHRLMLDVGPFLLLSNNVELVFDSGGGKPRDLWVKLRRSEPLVPSTDASPLALEFCAGSKLRLHSQNGAIPRLQWDDTPFQARLSCASSAPLLWNRSEIDIALPDIPLAQTLALDEDPGNARRPIPLYPFHVAQEAGVVVAGAALDAERITITVERGPASPRVSACSAQPRRQGALHCFGAASPAAPGYLQVPLATAMDLRFRVARGAGADRVGKAIFLADAGGTGPVLAPIVLGPGSGVRTTLAPSGQLRIGFVSVSSPPLDEGLAPSVLLDANVPYLTAPSVRVDVNRPGVAIQSASGQSVAPLSMFTFEGDTTTELGFCTPLIPAAAASTPGGSSWTEFAAAANAVFQTLHSANTEGTHESRIHIAPRLQDPSPTLRALYAMPARQVRSGGPTLGPHGNAYQIGPYTLEKSWGVGPAEAMLIRSEDVDMGRIRLRANGFEMDDTAPPAQRVWIKDISYDAQDGLEMSQPGAPRVLGVLKLGRNQTLLDMLRDAGVAAWELSDAENPDRLEQALPAAMRRADWVGLVLFSQALDLREFKLLASLLPTGLSAAGRLKLRYLAVSPDSAAQQPNFVTYGAVAWVNELPQEPAEPEYRDKEVLVQMLSLRMRWEARRLRDFRSITCVRVRGVLGVAKKRDGEDPELPTQIEIQGTIDRDTGTITFVAQFDEPLNLLGPGGLGPLKSLSVSSVTITRSGNRTAFDADGEIELGNWQVGAFSLGESDLPRLQFRGLRFGYNGDSLPQAGSWLAFDYPSMRFQFARGWSLFDFRWARAQLVSFGYDAMAGGKPFDWSDLVLMLGDQGDWANNLRRMRFGLDLDVGKLPLLNSSAFDTLHLNFELGFPILDKFTIEVDNPRLGLRAIGFDRLNLDLLGFLRITAEGAEFESRDGTLWLMMEDCTVSMLGHTLVKGFSFAYYRGRQGSGFVGAYARPGAAGTSLLEIDWILVGRNLRIERELAEKLISIAPAPDDTLHTQLMEAYRNDQLHAWDQSGIGEWIFAAGFRILGSFLDGKFLFQDNAYYGLALKGTLFEQVFGQSLELSVLYIRGARPEEDLCRLEFRVPSVEWGAISFNGGVVALEIQFNGGFLLDMGYPWLGKLGERRWDRGFGAMVSGIMGRGGMMIAKRSSARQQGKLLLIEGGVAVMVGFGAAFNAGIFRVHAYAGVYFVAEGAFLFHQASDTRLDLVGLQMTGAVGVQVRAVGELNWWVISVRVEILMGAEARLTLSWGLLTNHDPASPQLPAPPSSPPTDRVTVQLNFVLYARVSAHACIGSGFFKLCRGVSASVSMPYRHRLILE